MKIFEKTAVKVLLFFFICFIWGSTWFVIKVGLQELPVFLSLSLRFLTASVVLLFLLKTFKITVPLREKFIFLYLYLAFVSFLIPFSLVYWAELTIPSNLASVLFSTMPFFVVLFSRLFFKEELNLFQYIGLILGFIGVALIFKMDTVNYGDSFALNKRFVLSMFAVVLSALLNASVLIVVKKYGAEVHPLAINFLPLTLSGLALFVLSSIFEDWGTAKLSIKGVGSVIYLGVFGSIVTFTVYYWLLKKVPAVIMSLTAFLTPVFAIFIGVFVGKEKVSANILGGAFLVLTGVLMVNSYFIFKK